MGNPTYKLEDIIIELKDLFDDIEVHLFYRSEKQRTKVYITTFSQGVHGRSIKYDYCFLLNSEEPENLSREISVAIYHLREYAKAKYIS